MEADHITWRIAVKGRLTQRGWGIGSPIPPQAFDSSEALSDQIHHQQKMAFGFAVQHCFPHCHFAHLPSFGGEQFRVPAERVQCAQPTNAGEVHCDKAFYCSSTLFPFKLHVENAAA